MPFRSGRPCHTDAMKCGQAWAVVALALAATVVLASPAAAEPTPTTLPPGGTFFDDDGNVHEGAIEAIASIGVTRGCGVSDLYCPDTVVTRGQMAAFLVRAFEIGGSGGDPFVDDNGSVFEREISALASAGITRGCGPASFCPDDPVTRGQMAAFLVRALGLPLGPDAGFVDDEGSVFEREISALRAGGLTRGCNPPANDRFCPDQPVLRDQMAAFLQRALGLAPNPPPPRPSLTMAFTGDILIHSPVWKRAQAYGSPYDFTPMLAPLAPVIAAADWGVCHLETPLAADNRGISGYPNFNAPRQVADAVVAAGYDACSTASNHSYDQGVTGIESTLRVLSEVGLQQAGMATSARTGGSASHYYVGERVVGHIAATYWLNGYSLPADKPWLVQLIDVPAILDQARAARRAGAEVVVVSLHCCTEYRTAPTSYQRDVARELIASPDIDLVVGHHAHVVQPIEEIDGEYIVYGLGNSLSAQRRLPSTQDGVVVTVEFALRGAAWAARGVTAHPTWVDGSSYVVKLAAEHNPASWRRTAAALTLDGTPRGLTIVR